MPVSCAAGASGTQKNEDATRKSYTLGLATGAQAQDKALAGIERLTDRSEADNQFALDWAYAQAVQDQWSQEAFLNSPDYVAIAKANVDWWSAQESASVTAEQAIDAAYHLPWTAFLAGQAAAHQSWFNNSGNSAYLQWTNDRLSDQHTWSSNVRQAQYQEFATQRTAQRTETKSIADSTRDEKTAIAAARYTYIADSNSGIATPAKDYLDSLAQAEHDHAIALTKAAYDRTVHENDPNYTGDPSADYDAAVDQADENEQQTIDGEEQNYSSTATAAFSTRATSRANNEYALNVALKSIGCKLPLAAVYEKVKFRDTPEGPAGTTVELTSPDQAQDGHTTNTPNQMYRQQCRADQSISRSALK